MPQVVAFAAQIGAVIKTAFVAYLGTTVGTAVYSALVNYAFSSILMAFSGGGRQRVGVNQKEREVNYRGGDNNEEVLIGKSRRGGSVFMYQNATVAGVDYVYVGLFLNCFHQIKAIDKVWIGDKPEDHPDFSDMKLAKRYITFSDGAVGVASTVVETVVVLFEGVSTSVTIPVGSLASDKRDLVFNALVMIDGFTKSKKNDTSDDGNGNTVNDYKIIISKNKGENWVWDFEFKVNGSNSTLLEGNSKTKDYVRITRFLGDQTEANPLILSELKDNTTALYPFDETHIGHERAGVFVRYEKNWLRLNFGAVPNTFMDIRGHNQLIDPRTGLKGYSTNPVVVAYNAMLDNDIYSANSEDMTLDVWKAEVNICDEQVQIKSDGTKQNRYEFNGGYSYSWQPADVLTVIANSCDGKYIDRGHSIVMRVGTDRTPVYHITQDDIEGGFNYQASESLGSKSNRIIGTFINASQNFGQTSYPSVLIDDGFNRKSKSVNFDSEIDVYRAQRLASIALLKPVKSTPISFTLRPLSLDNDLIEVGSYVTLENDYLGIDKTISWEVVSRKFNSDGSSVVILERRLDYIYQWDYAKAVGVDGAITAPYTVTRDELLEGIAV